MELEHFIKLVNQVKKYVKSKQQNLTLVNGDGVKLQFIIKKFTKIPKGKVDVVCTICEGPQRSKIITPRGAPLIYEELMKNDRLDWVKWHLEEFILGKM
ncbi:MAG: hypothetical protein H8D97_00545 [Proteobacteria bacterium]|nr:hypothetical protein [Pseudomonadota bacterium]